MKVDVIIVGSGISGCCAAWKLFLQGKTCKIITDRSFSSSSVAAGVYNPTILKRFTSVWKGAEQMDEAIPFYKNIEAILQKKLLHPIHVLRRFHDEKEMKTWIKKSEKEELTRFMNNEVISNLQINGIDAPFGYGEVRETGWLDTNSFMKHTMEFFSQKGCVLKEMFEHDILIAKSNEVYYKELIADHIVFVEGFRMKKNPFFHHLPMQGNKGEVLTIKVPDLKLDYIIKSAVFLMPYRDDLFWVGATYNREDLTYSPTAGGLDFLTSRLDRFLKLPYDIIDHKAGIRPTTIDRRPFVGNYNEKPSIWCFNGMGSRAVLVAPWAAHQLYNTIFEGVDLLNEIDIKRFDKGS